MVWYIESMSQMKRQLEERVEALAIHMMHVRGYKDGEHSLEWDRTREDSQFSFCLEDAREAVLFLLRYED